MPILFRLSFIKSITLTVFTMLVFSTCPVWGQSNDESCEPIDEVNNRPEAIVARGCIIVGVLDNGMPLSDFIDGEWQGIEPAMARQLAQSRFGDPNAVRFQNLGGDLQTGLNQLDTGTVDIVMAAQFPGKGNDDQADFSEIYLYDRLLLLTMPNSPLTGIDDLVDTQIAVMNDPLLHNILTKTFPNHVFVNVRSTSSDFPLDALRKERYGAIAGRELILADFLELNKYSHLPVEPFELSYQIAVRKGDRTMVGWVNCALSGVSIPAEWTALFAELPIPLSPTPVVALTGDNRADELGMPQISTIQKLCQRGHLIAGVEAETPLMGYQEADGTWGGFEVDLIREFAKRWLGSSEDVEFVHVASKDRIRRLLSGELDLLAAMMIHYKRPDNIINFSQIYYQDGQNFLVRANEEVWPTYDAARIALLDGKRIGLIRESPASDNLITFAHANQISIEIMEFGYYTETVEALLSGQIDVVTGDRSMLMDIEHNFPELMLLLNQDLSKKPYGMGIRPGDSIFTDWVNHTLQMMKEDGTYDTLYNNWFCAGSSNMLCPTPYLIEILPGDPPYNSVSASMLRQDQCEPVLDRIDRERFFVAGVRADAPPFGYRGEKTGEFTGFEVELMQEFARRWLGDENAVEFSAVTSNNRSDELNNCRIDIIAATMTHNRSRDALTDFSITYYQDGQNILVRSNPDLRNGDDDTRLQSLDGLKIGVVRGSTSIDRIQTYMDANGVDIEFAEFDQYDQAVQPLLDGNIDGLTTDRGILLGLAQQHPGLLVFLDENFSEEPYGLGVRNGDHRFLDLVNYTLQEMKEDGSYDSLYRKWFCAQQEAIICQQPYAIQILPTPYFEVTMTQSTVLTPSPTPDFEVILPQNTAEALHQLTFSVEDSGETRKTQPLELLVIVSHIMLLGIFVAHRGYRKYRTASRTLASNLSNETK